jgi:hypothetical protein
VAVALDVDIDDDVDLDSSVEVDGSEAIHSRLTPIVDLDLAPLSRSVAAAAQDRSTSNVDGGLNVVRRRQPQRSGSTIRSTSTSSSTTAVKVKAQVDVNRAMRRGRPSSCSTLPD